jgi:hypothetical protein
VVIRRNSSCKIQPMPIAWYPMADPGTHAGGAAAMRRAISS